MQNIDDIRIAFNPDMLWLINLCLSVLMFSVALNLTVDDFKRLANRPLTVGTGLISQLVLLPIATLGLIYAWSPPPSVALGLCLVAACPGGNVSNYAVHLAGGDRALSVTLTSIVTVTAIFTTPVLFSVLGGLSEGTSELLQTINVRYEDLASTIAMLLLMPLSIGMWIRHQFPSMAKRLNQVIGKLSMIIFVCFILGAIWSDRAAILSHLHHVFWLVIVHNIMAMLIGYSAATIMRRTPEERKAITLETGIQNSGLGLVIIFNFYASLGGMMLVAAWWGIWDLISSGAVAMYWRKAKMNDNQNVKH